MREMTRAIRKTLLALTALATLASSANAGHRVTGRVTLDVDVYVEEVVPADEPLDLVEQLNASPISLRHNSVFARHCHRPCGT
jgi:hypothetical protein